MSAWSWVWWVFGDVVMVLIVVLSGMGVLLGGEDSRAS